MSAGVSLLIGSTDGVMVCTSRRTSPALAQYSLRSRQAASNARPSRCGAQAQIAARRGRPRRVARREPRRELVERIVLRIEDVVLVQPIDLRKEQPGLERGLAHAGLTQVALEHGHEARGPRRHQRAEALEHVGLHAHPVGQRPECAMAAHQRRGAAQQRGQAPRGILHGVGSREGLAHIGQALLEDRAQQRGLAVEVVVDQAWREPGGPRHRFDGRGRVAAFAKQPQAFFDQLRARAVAHLGAEGGISGRHVRVGY